MKENTDRAREMRLGGVERGMCLVLSYFISSFRSTIIRQVCVSCIANRMVEKPQGGGGVG